MALSIVSRSLLRTSREILERNMAATVGALQQQQQHQPLSTFSTSDCNNNVSVCIRLCVCVLVKLIYEKSGWASEEGKGHLLQLQENEATMCATEIA